MSPSSMSGGSPPTKTFLENLSPELSNPPCDPWLRGEERVDEKKPELLASKTPPAPPAPPAPPPPLAPALASSPAPPPEYSSPPIKDDLP